ncbi:MAG: hypothetical protein ACTH1T_03015, partial [Brachybacterium tyrofermentans]
MKLSQLVAYHRAGCTCAIHGDAVSPLCTGVLVDAAAGFRVGIRARRFLRIVLEADSRAAADRTQAVVDAMQHGGGDAAPWRAEPTGHGSNYLDNLHRLRAVVLGFAA